MTGKRQRYSAEFKVKVAMEALRGELTTAQWATKHGVHQTVSGDWKRQAVVVLLPACRRNGGEPALMHLIDMQFLETPWYGSRQMARHLRRDGHAVGCKRVRRLTAVMGLALIYQRPRTMVPNLAKPLGLRPEHRVWPYLAWGMVIDRPNQVWCTNITTRPLSCPTGGVHLSHSLFAH